MSLLRFRVRDYVGSLNVYHENGVFIGEMIRDVDGYYYWWPVARTGTWDAPVLRALADTLDVLNAKWDAHVNQFFGQQEKRCG